MVMLPRTVSCPRWTARTHEVCRAIQETDTQQPRLPAEQPLQKAAHLNERDAPEQRVSSPPKAAASGRRQQQQQQQNGAGLLAPVASTYDVLKRRLGLQTTRRHDAEIFAIAGPALLSLAADPLLSLIDTAFVGRLGPAELVGARLLCDSF